MNGQKNNSYAVTHKESYKSEYYAWIVYSQNLLVTKETIMQKIKRKKVVKAQLKNELSKLERRIQTIANHAYEIRQAIDAITKQENLHALHPVRTESSIREGSTDREGGKPQLSDNPIVNQILAEQSTEL